MSARARVRPVMAVAAREVVTLARTRAVAMLAVAFALTTVGVALVTDAPARGYVPAVIDLLTPMELLVPVLAVALGYRAILGDATRGELEVLRTYPLRPWQHVAGAFLGRAVGVVAVVVLSLGLVGVLVAVTPAETVRIYATHETADSPLLFARFVVLTAALGLVFLAIALAISALARSTRGAIAAGAAVLLVALLALEVAIAQGLAGGWVAEDRLAFVLALVPNGAYRGLVLETAVTVTPGDARAASPVASAVSLAGWAAVGLVAAALGLGRRA